MEIIQNFIEGLPHIPYANGIGNYIGVAAHSTGNYGDKLGDTLMCERNWEVQTWGSAFVHFFCGDEGILQVADINYRAYGAGSPANGRYVHVELLQTLDHDKFLKGYANYVFTLAYVLVKKKFEPLDTRTIVSHSWISKQLGGTDHSDPDGYLASHGKSWADLVKDVVTEYRKQTAPVVAIITTNSAIDFICAKIKSVDNAYWHKQAESVYYFDSLVTKIATKWTIDNASEYAEVKRIPPILPTLETSLAFIDSKVHLTDYVGWLVKAKNVKYLEQFLCKIYYVWKKEMEVKTK